MYRTAEFEQDLKRRNFEGFKLGEIILRYRLTQEKDGVTKIIDLPYSRDMSHRNHQPFIMRLPEFAVRFSKVEQILGVVMKNFDRSYRDDRAVTIHTLTDPVENVDYEVFNLQISSSETFNIVFDEIEKIICKAGIPFFERYVTLDVAFRDLEQMATGETAKFKIPLLALRRMIMKKLYDDPGYKNYANEMILYAGKKPLSRNLHIAEALHAYLMENY